MKFIRINTLDANVYKNVQQALIDALDKGEYVHILGKDKNETDLKVQLYRLSDPAKETIFETAWRMSIFRSEKYLLRRYWRGQTEC